MNSDWIVLAVPIVISLVATYAAWQQSHTRRKLDQAVGQEFMDRQRHALGEGIDLNLTTGAYERITPEPYDLHRPGIDCDGPGLCLKCDTKED